jgi:signal transduction histidine kinase
MNASPANRILLIDDMPSIHEDFRRILAPAAVPDVLSNVEHALFGTQAEPAPDFSLDCAASGEEGLDLVKAALSQGRPYALAFVDMRMPAGWHGVRTIEELWAEDPQLQVVICTAYSDEPLEHALPRLGASDRLLVLKKPFDPVEVSQMARALVAKWRLAREAACHLADLEQALRGLHERAAELARSNRELEQFAYVASHDLSEPLRMVASFAQLLSRRYADRLDADARDFIGYMIEGAQRMKRLIDDLLSYSRVGKAPALVDIHSMDEALGAALANLETAVQETGAVIERPAALPALRCDLTAMTQLFQNLIANALKFRGADPPRVRIAVERDKKEWTISIADNGIGIAPEHRERLFVIFGRLHLHAQYEGSGIGLAICKKIVEQHGGRIWVESDPGAGSCFKFTLPLSLAVPPQQAALAS